MPVSGFIIAWQMISSLDSFVSIWSVVCIKDFLGDIPSGVITKKDKSSVVGLKGGIGFSFLLLLSISVLSCGGIQRALSKSSRNL